MQIIDSIPALTKDEARKLIDIWVRRYNLTQSDNLILTAENDKLQAYYDEELKAVYLEVVGPEVSPEEIQGFMNFK